MCLLSLWMLMLAYICRFGSSLYKPAGGYMSLFSFCNLYNNFWNCLFNRWQKDGVERLEVPAVICGSLTDIKKLILLFKLSFMLTFDQLTAHLIANIHTVLKVSFVNHIYKYLHKCNYYHWDFARRYWCWKNSLFH